MMRTLVAEHPTGVSGSDRSAQPEGFQTRAFWSLITEGEILDVAEFAANGAVPFFGFAPLAAILNWRCAP